MISKGEFSASYRHIFLNIPDKFPEVLERNSYDLGQQRGRFRTCMQAIQETPLMTVDSFNWQFQIGEKERKVFKCEW